MPQHRTCLLFHGATTNDREATHAPPFPTRLFARGHGLHLDGTARQMIRAGLSTLSEGQMVEFDIVQNKGKSSAENLKPIGG
jgi:hypothetical protein